MSGKMATNSGGQVSKDGFEETKFMKELIHLRDTQEAIQSLSAWCLKNKKAAYKIARCWLKVVKKVKVEQKLALFYLLNDVVQHSKRKNCNEHIERFQSVLKEAMPHLKDESICGKIKRVLNIWSERAIFPDKFLKELTAILEIGKKKDINDIVDSFQPTQLCTQIKIMKALEDDSDYKLKTLSESDVNLVEFDEASIRQSLTDRQHGNDYINDIEKSKKNLELYIKAVDREITKRRQVKDLLEQAKKYYDSLYDEANIVTTAYATFAKKVKTVQKRLDTKIPELDSYAGNKSVASLLSDADLSPMPSPDYDAPSPEPDDQETELKLPDEQVQAVHQAVNDGGEQMSISEYLTRLAGQDQPSNNGYYYHEPAATAWPAPKTDDYAAGDSQWAVNSQDDPVPEWQIQPVDEEPPDEVVEENLVMSRLQSRNVVEVKTDAANNAHVDMEVVNSEDETEHQAPELSIHERLSNLAGVPLPPHPPPQMQQPPPFQQPPPQQPRPLFAERPPMPPMPGPRGPMRGPRGGGGFRGGFSPRRPFRGRGGHGGFRGRW